MFTARVKVATFISQTMQFRETVDRRHFLRASTILRSSYFSVSSVCIYFPICAKSGIDKLCCDLSALCVRVCDVGCLYCVDVAHCFVILKFRGQLRTHPHAACVPKTLTCADTCIKHMWLEIRPAALCACLVRYCSSPVRQHNSNRLLPFVDKFERFVLPSC